MIKKRLGMAVCSLFIVGCLGVNTAQASTWWWCDLGNNNLCVDTTSDSPGPDVTLYGFFTNYGFYYICTNCHSPNTSRPRDRSMMNAKMAIAHLTNNFPKYRVSLAPGKSINFQKEIYITNKDGRLWLKSSKGLKVLPPDTLIVKGPLSDTPFIIMKGKPQF